MGYAGRTTLIVLLMLTLITNLPSTGIGDKIYSPSHFEQWNYLQADDNMTKEVETISIPEQTILGMGRSTGSISLAKGEEFTFPSVHYNNDVSLQFDNVYEDLLQYNTNFSQVWEEGTGSYITDYNNTTGHTTVAVENEAYNNVYSFAENRPVSPGTYFNTSLVSLTSSITDDQFGYFHLRFVFESFQVTIVYHATDSYEEILQSNGNSSGQITLLSEDSYDHELNLTELVEIAGGVYPTTLYKVSIYSYVNELYNLTATFDQLNIMEPQDTIQLSEPNEKLQDLNKQVSLLPLQTYRVKLHSDISAVLVWERRHAINQTISIETKLARETIQAMVSLQPEGEDENYIYTYHLGEILTINSTTATEFNSTHIWYQGGAADSYTLQGNLQRDRKTIHPPLLQQGSSFDLNNHTYQWLYLYHVDQNILIRASQAEKTVVPPTWSKGEVIVYLISLTGKYQSWTQILDLSPSQLVSATSFRFLTTQRIQIPFTMENVSSNQEVAADSVIIHYNDTIWRVVGEYGLIIEPGDLSPGTTRLEVNITQAGYVPITFQLRLHVEEPAMDVQFRASHMTPELTKFEIHLPEITNWTLGINISVTGKDLQKQQYTVQAVTVMELNHPTWDRTQNHTIGIVLELEEDLGRYNYTYTITPFGEKENSIGLGTILTVGSLTGIIGTSAVKMYQIRKGKESISF